MEAVCCVARPSTSSISSVCYTFLASFLPYHWCSFFSNLFSILLWLVFCIRLYLFNSLPCLFQFHCLSFHILNLHSFCLLNYSFFIYLLSFSTVFTAALYILHCKENIKYCLTPSFCLSDLLQSLCCYQAVPLREQFIFSSFSLKPISLQSAIWHLSELVFIFNPVELLWLLISARFSFQSDFSNVFSSNFSIFFLFNKTRNETRSRSATLTLWQILASKLSEYRSTKLP